MASFRNLRHVALGAAVLGSVSMAVAVGFAALNLPSVEDGTQVPPAPLGVPADSAYPRAQPGPDTIVLRADGTLLVWQLSNAAPAALQPNAANTIP